MSTHNHDHIGRGFAKQGDDTWQQLIDSGAVLHPDVCRELGLVQQIDALTKELEEVRRRNRARE